MQIWFDRFSRHSDRKLWYGFYSPETETIKQAMKHAGKDVGQALELRDNDVDYEQRPVVLNRKLRRADFGRPHIEHYNYDGENFFGVYDFEAVPRTKTQRSRLVERVVSFFETVARDLPQAKPADTEREVYPKLENRKVVVSHLRRERNGHLATLRKQRDNYHCQICNMRFEGEYGPIGLDFAEAHHIVPLSKIGGITSTSISDLITVCANCHRMLHRMDGKSGDTQRLRKFFKQHHSKAHRA